MITQLAKNAAAAARAMRRLTEEKKNSVLKDMANEIRASISEIIAANEQDMQQAKQDNLAPAMLDRLLLNEERIQDMATGIDTIVELPDPVGQTRKVTTRPNGLDISKVNIPLGVICMIYEARPNVTADASALCFKSGNGVILRGGKEAIHSSKAIAKVLHRVLKAHGLPEALISVVPDPSREHMLSLMQQKDYIDVVIPRGGEGLIKFVTENSLIPVIQHFKGVCHLYVDEHADLEKALNILVNGKTQRTGVCNALEGLVVHEKIKDKFLPMVNTTFMQHKVKVNACELSAHYFDQPTVLEEHEFGQEYLDLEIAVRLVNDIEEAMAHIDSFGSNHTEVICSEDADNIALFQKCVDASVIMVNASSRFSDGSQLGLGAEIGIATSKLHAYGPMGLEALTTEKFLVEGTGQVRA